MAYLDSTTNTGSDATLTTAVPAGVAADDIVVLAATADTTAHDFTSLWPASFTEIVDENITRDGQSFGMAWKRLTGSDAGSYTLGALGGATSWILQAYAFRGRHTTDPPVVGTPGVDSTALTSPVTATAGGVTALEGDDLLWVVCPDTSVSTGYLTTTAPGGYSKREDQEAGIWAALAGATLDDVAAGATGGVSGSFTLDSGNSGYAAALVRIPEGAAAGPWPPPGSEDAPETLRTVAAPRF